MDLLEIFNYSDVSFSFFFFFFGSLLEHLDLSHENK